MYLLPGVGDEVRLVSSLGNPTASEASLGLRVRLPPLTRAGGAAFSASAAGTRHGRG